MNIIDNLGWIFVGVSFAGYLLNIKKNKWCFALWITCSIWWLGVSIYREQWSLVANFILYLSAECWGLYKWSKDEFLKCLLRIISQYCYRDFEDDIHYHSDNNSVGYTVSLLVKNKYAEYESEIHWPETKFFNFRLTKKGMKLLQKG